MPTSRSELWERLSIALPDTATLVILACLLAAVVWGIMRVRSRMREATDTAGEALDLLGQFRELHEGGGLTDDEYRLIKRRLIDNGNLAGEFLKTKQGESGKKTLMGTATKPVARLDSPDSLTTRTLQQDLSNASDGDSSESSASVTQD